MVLIVQDAFRIEISIDPLYGDAVLLWAMRHTVVLKFGGASVATIPLMKNAAKIIADRKKEYQRVVVVVSAMGTMTCELMALAKKLHPSPPAREQDMLLSVGERISMSMLAMALDLIGIQAVSFTGSQSGIITTEDHTDARIVAVHPTRVKEALDQGKVCIVAGFQGVSRTKEITTLGRGGSDTTAVALAMALEEAHVEFFKDVAGIYDRDPSVDSEAKLLNSLSYAEAKEIVERCEHSIIHPRALELASDAGVPLLVRSFHSHQGLDEQTWVGQEECSRKNRTSSHSKVEI